MLAILLLIAAICLIVLNPFQGAAVIGAVAVVVTLLVTILGFVMIAKARKTVDEFQKRVLDND